MKPAYIWTGVADGHEIRFEVLRGWQNRSRLCVDGALTAEGKSRWLRSFPAIDKSVVVNLGEVRIRVELVSEDRSFYPIFSRIDDQLILTWNSKSVLMVNRRRVWFNALPLWVKIAVSVSVAIIAISAKDHSPTIPRHFFNSWLDLFLFLSIASLKSVDVHCPAPVDV